MTGPATVLALVALGSGCGARSEDGPLERTPLGKPIPTASRPETIHLQNGFVPDPWVRDGQAVQATAEGPGCPSPFVEKGGYRLIAEDSFATLRILVLAEGPTRLVFRKPNGSDECVGGPGIEPVLTTALEANEYRFWVTSESSGQTFRLGLSELSSTEPPSLARALGVLHQDPSRRAEPGDSPQSPPARTTRD